MKNSQKGFAPVVLLIIAIGVLVVGGGTYVVLRNQTPAQDNYATNNNLSQNEDWKTHTSQEVGFTISYPETYHVYLDHNLINYDENKYERGNPSGVKIQVQKHSKENYGYDLSTSDGVKKFVDKLNTNRPQTDELGATNTALTPISLGVFKFKSKVLGGPGGAFDVYYAFSNKDTYYMVLVWGENNDQETVSRILSTFKMNPSGSTQSSGVSTNTLTFITPVESETLTRGNSHVVIWDGVYSGKLILKVVSTPVGSNFSSIVADTVSSSNKRNQIVWDIPCNFDYSQGWYRLVFIDKATNVVVASSPAFGISKEQRAGCVSTQETNTIIKSEWGVSFSKSANWDITSNASGIVELKQVSGEWVGDTIDIAYITGANITTTDAKFGSVTYYWDEGGQKWMKIGQSEKTGETESPVPATTYSEYPYVASIFPVFVGTNRWLTLIVPLSHTSFLKLHITGSGQTQPLKDLLKTIKKI